MSWDGLWYQGSGSSGQTVITGILSASMVNRTLIGVAESRILTGKIVSRNSTGYAQAEMGKSYIYNEGLKALSG